MESRKVLINPTVRWAIESTHSGSIEYVQQLAPRDGIHVPHEGDVLTVPFMVDPATKQPCPVRVTRIEHLRTSTGHVVVPVVVRAEQD